MSKRLASLPGTLVNFRFAWLATSLCELRSRRLVHEGFVECFGSRTVHAFTRGHGKHFVPTSEACVTSFIYGLCKETDITMKNTFVNTIVWKSFAQSIELHFFSTGWGWALSHLNRFVLCCLCTRNNAELCIYIYNIKLINYIPLDFYLILNEV